MIRILMVVLYTLLSTLALANDHASSQSATVSEKLCQPVEWTYRFGKENSPLVFSLKSKGGQYCLKSPEDESRFVLQPDISFRFRKKTYQVDDAAGGVACLRKFELDPGRLLAFFHKRGFQFMMIGRAPDVRPGSDGKRTTLLWFDFDTDDEEIICVEHRQPVFTQE